MIKVGALLLNWNSGEFTIPCIDSLLASTWIPWRIVVLDNASTDGSPDLIARKFPQVKLFKSPHNMGFAKGNNVGIRQLLSDGADLVWLLNNDTTVDNGCLFALVAAMQSQPDIAVATGKILFAPPLENRIWYAGAHWRYWSLTAPHRGQREHDNGQYNVALDVGFVSGCCMLIRRQVFEQIGFLEESYFAYDEDAEWCLRAVHAGLRMRYVPEAVLWHHVSATIRKNTLGMSRGTAPPRAYYLITRNRIYTIRRYADRPWQLITSVALLLANRIYLSAGMAALGRWDKLQSVWRGFVDGFRTE